MRERQRENRNDVIPSEYVVRAEEPAALGVWLGGLTVGCGCDEQQCSDGCTVAFSVNCGPVASGHSPRLLAHIIRQSGPTSHAAGPVKGIVKSLLYLGNFNRGCGIESGAQTPVIRKAKTC